MRIVEYVSGVGGRFYPQANEWKEEFVLPN